MADEANPSPLGNAAAPAPTGTAPAGAPATGTAPATAPVTPPAGDKPAEGAPASPAVAPVFEVYEALSVPEGFTADTELMKGFVKAAVEAKIPKGEAQKLLDVYIEQEKKEIETLKAQVATWAKEYQTEAGKAELKAANDALKHFADEEVIKLISSDPVLGNHPAVIKMFAKIAKVIAPEGKSLDSTPGRSKKSMADLLFG
jgi:hypothetical protein